MAMFPMAEIGGLPISRLICGSNPFLGFSHYSAARDRWLKEYFTVERMVEVVEEIATERGISMVLERTRSNVVWAAEEVDLTDEAIRRYEERY